MAIVLQSIYTAKTQSGWTFGFNFVKKKMNFKWGLLDRIFVIRDIWKVQKRRNFQFLFRLSNISPYLCLKVLPAYIFKNITCIIANAIYLVMRIFTFRAHFGVR